ncbi:hypothetical protein STENM223S_08565 [Streptomyces tendae]
MLRGPREAEGVARLEREYENVRTALRHAVTRRDEQEAICITLSLVWYWQMRDLRIEARNWCREVMALAPDPFAEPVRPAAPLWQRCTDRPPPLTGELLAEARRGVHLAHLAQMDTELDDWQTPQAQHRLRLVAATYEPGLPQACRPPGLLWTFAVMLTGDMERLREVVDAAVRTSRENPGFEWELACNLQLRANFLANRSDWAGDARRDADEALEIHRRLGDTWGTAGRSPRAQLPRPCRPAGCRRAGARVWRGSGPWRDPRVGAEAGDGGGGVGGGGGGTHSATTSSWVSAGAASCGALARWPVKRRNTSSRLGSSVVTELRVMPRAVAAPTTAVNCSSLSTGTSTELRSVSTVVVASPVIPRESRASRQRAQLQRVGRPDPQHGGRRPWPSAPDAAAAAITLPPSTVSSEASCSASSMYWVVSGTVTP